MVHSTCVQIAITPLAAANLTFIMLCSKQSLHHGSVRSHTVAVRGQLPCVKSMEAHRHTMQRLWTVPMSGVCGDPYFLLRSNTSKVQVFTGPQQWEVCVVSHILKSCFFFKSLILYLLRQAFSNSSANVQWCTPVIHFRNACSFTTDVTKVQELLNN